MHDRKQAELDVAGRIEALARPVVASLGCELVEASYHSGLLRVRIDKPGGISHDDCEAVSRVIGAQLDVEESIAQPYTLEVSSPGLDRRLRRPEEYDKYRGRLAKIKTSDQVLVGRLEGLAEDQVILLLDNGEARRVPVQEVREARLMVEFGR
jgi:ribosome maturation factor RimP